jgi:3-oxoacyl-[acyl-carrier protein] reductase
VLTTSVMQNVLMAKAFVPAMQHKQYGRIVAISTECVMQSFPTQSAYTSGKRGMDAIVRVLAKEVGPDGITVRNTHASAQEQSVQCSEP